MWYAGENIGRNTIILRIYLKPCCRKSRNPDKSSKLIHLQKKKMELDMSTGDIENWVFGIYCFQIESWKNFLWIPRKDLTPDFLYNFRSLPKLKYWISFNPPSAEQHINLTLLLFFTPNLQTIKLSILWKTSLFFFTSGVKNFKFDSPFEQFALKFCQSIQKVEITNFSFGNFLFFFFNFFFWNKRILILEFLKLCKNS